MLTAIIDYESGNLHSAHKAFERMAAEADAGSVVVTSDPEVVSRADRLVLPGDGAFPACRDALVSSSVFEALRDAVENKARPFLGICVGMQLMAKRGFEYHETEGLGWINGEVRAIKPDSQRLKIPHMGWNDLIVAQEHPILKDVNSGDHAYFVHSYQMNMGDKSELYAYVDYGGAVSAVVGRDTMVGMQFHPEKSANIGLQLIANFLRWSP
ncbi:MAG: imidazole glycerol phosphate synthase subunit HisH [Paracoccaceae bacterium]|tara:strand:- start:157 stop:792 length:636 start_codon:yes stop_codon:yes gene_type:complete